MLGSRGVEPIVCLVALVDQTPQRIEAHSLVVAGLNCPERLGGVIRINLVRYLFDLEVGQLLTGAIVAEVDGLDAGSQASGADVEISSLGFDARERQLRRVGSLFRPRSQDETAFHGRVCDVVRSSINGVQKIVPSASLGFLVLDRHTECLS